MPQPARQFHEQQVHYLRRTITFADVGLTLDVGTIPAGSIILRPISGVAVTTAFNGGTSSTLDVGPSTDSGTDLYATAITLAALNFVALDETVTNLVTVDTRIQCDITVTGAAATAGVAEVIICYIPDNDL